MTSYKDAGVDVNAGYKAVELIKKHVEKTVRPEVLSGIGGFGGLFSLENINIKKPVLVSGTDGVGTKLKLAFLMDKHDTIGIDCVAMCVNDIICSGAQPLFFLDYIATGKIYPEKIEQIVKGISYGCQMAGCALLGGETAEMPGFYPDDEYDLAGFAVGIADRDKIIDGSSIKEGDKIIGLASSGIHSNGYSLVRKIIDMKKLALDSYSEELGAVIGEVLLAPTRIYAKSVQNALKKYEIKGIANITGGGFIENIPRTIPEGLRAVIRKGTWPVLPVFDFIRKHGNVPDSDMYNTFNMGIGMVIIAGSDIGDELTAYFEEIGEKAYLIGEIEKGEEKMLIC